jgi:uncharacterized protein YbjT (DUF2867 family)
MIGMTATENGQPLTLILGGNGKTGRRIVLRLATDGVPTRVGSRSGRPAFDWEDVTTWPAAVDGVGAAYVSFYPDLAVPGAADTVGSFARLAVDSGVSRLVLLSGRGEPEAQRAEELVRAASAEATVLRASWFCQNFSESFLLDGVLEGTISLPVGDVLEPFVDADDIAAVAVAALTDDGHAGRLYELTGPRLLTFAGATQEIAEATGRTLRFRSQPAAEWVAGLSRAGLPGDVVWLMNYLFTEVLDGRNSHLTDGVRQALGRGPRDVQDYARDAAASGVWDR